IARIERRLQPRCEATIVSLSFLPATSVAGFHVPLLRGSQSAGTTVSSTQADSNTIQRVVTMRAARGVRAVSSRPGVLEFGQCLRGRGCWRRIAVVLSFQVIPADSKHFQHHAGTVDQWIDAGSTAVPPDDGNFLHFEFELPSQEENLGIKTPAFNLLQREDRLNCGSPESFEAALGVLEFQTKGEAQDQVVDSAEELAVQRLPLRLGFGPQPARADGDIGTFFKRFEKLGSFFDRRRKVRVAEQDAMT